MLSVAPIVLPQFLQPQPHYHPAGYAHHAAPHPHHHAAHPQHHHQYPQQLQQQQHQHQHSPPGYFAAPSPYTTMPHRQPPDQPPYTPPGSTHANGKRQLSRSAAVAQALEIARESPDGAADPTIRQILDGALEHLWARVLAEPESYVMTREEFSVFNYFQHKFADDHKELAVAMRRRYWDNLRA